MLEGPEAPLQQASWEPVKQSNHIREILTTIAFFHVVQDWTKGYVQKLRLMSSFLFKLGFTATTNCIWFLQYLWLLQIITHHIVLFDLGKEFFYLWAEHRLRAELGQRRCISDQIVKH